MLDGRHAHATLKGGISIVSQSGAVATVMKHFAHQHGVGMNVVAATGNEAMLGLAECVDYLVDDESTKVIAVFAETVRDTRLFRAAAERALAKAKPIVVLKVGRSDIATQAAQSHGLARGRRQRVRRRVPPARAGARAQHRGARVHRGAARENRRAGRRRGRGAVVLGRHGRAGRGLCAAGNTAPARLVEMKRSRRCARSFRRWPHRQPAGPDGRSRQRSGALHLLHGCDAARSGRLRAGLRGRRAHGEQQRLGAVCGGERCRPSGSSPDGRARYLVVSNTVKAVSDKSREEVEKAQIPYLACGLDIALRALRYAADWSRMSRSAGGERAARALPGAASTAGADLPQSERETVDYLKRFGVPVVPQVLATDAKQAVAAARDMNGPVVLRSPRRTSRTRPRSAASCSTCRATTRSKRRSAGSWTRPPPRCRRHGSTA